MRERVTLILPHHAHATVRAIPTIHAAVTALVTRTVHVIAIPRVMRTAHATVIHIRVSAILRVTPICVRVTDRAGRTIRQDVAAMR